MSVTWKLPPETCGHAGVVLSAGRADKPGREPVVVCLDTVLSDRHRDMAHQALRESGVTAPVHFLTAVKHDGVWEKGDWTQWFVVSCL